ncbi:DNL zinc finger-domain-containing protein [Coniochaeta sp. 2T2.1]|nr:DNL zinc finger-domain-containing protein [Coniochaeta sp. 2T2.1]
MASRRPVTLASNCLKLRTALQPQLAYRPLFLSAPKAPASIPKSHSPFLSSIRQKHTIPRPPSSQPRPSPTPSEPNGLPNSATSSSSSSSSSSSETTSSDSPRSPPPQYELTFTCVPCDTRSTHKVSKQGYHHGSVLIACPSCKNRHVISDHLKIFGDRRITVEDLLREKGQLVKKGALDGDIEFWDDGSTTVREQGEVETQEEGTGEKWRGEAPGSSFKNKAGSEGAA